MGGFVYIFIVRAITKNKCPKTMLNLSLVTGVEYPVVLFIWVGAPKFYGCNRYVIGTYSTYYKAYKSISDSSSDILTPNAEQIFEKILIEKFCLP
jgi:hypothetical protein